MLKIKDDVELKELEKFGFEKFPNGYFKKVYLGNAEDDRVCYKIDCNRTIEITRLDGELDDTLYDLIQARISRESGGLAYGNRNWRICKD